MKIGIDAKWFFEGPISNRIVLQQILHCLIPQSKNHELYIFLDKRHQNEEFPYKSEKIHLEYIWAKNNQLSNVFVIPKKARKLQLDVVLFQNFVSPFGKFKKIAYIHDIIPFSNPEFYTYKERLYFSTLPYLCRKADLIITISENEKKRINRIFKKIPKVVAIHHGRNTDFEPKASYSKSKLKEIITKYNLPPKYLLFVGRLNIRKNIQNLLRALAILKNRETPLVIVGEKEWKTANIEKVIAEQNLENRVIFTGRMPYEDLLLVYALAHIFCFPSLEEGFGLPPLEAMSAGVPVVVSDLSAMPEVCGEAGTYINPNSPENIAKKIDLLLDNQTYHQEKQSLGFLQAQKFDWQITAQKLLETIEVLCS